MNKLIKIALVAALFTSLVAKAEELALEAAHEEQAQEEVINHFESIPGYQANEAAAEEEILDQSVSHEAAEEASES